MTDKYSLDNIWAAQNVFVAMQPEYSEPPVYETVKKLIPVPHLSGNPVAEKCYWKVWEFAFRNIRKADGRNGFAANCIDTAFNNHIFMWDSVFILMFCRYAARAFNFQRTLDTFYRKQHSDGFISREINIDNGEDRWESYDPVSTGPNVMPWSEYEYWLNYGDRSRLEAVFPPLVAYHEWLRMNRRWKDGSYWSNGYACGMDNQPRIRNDSRKMQDAHHGFMSWIDMNFQMLFSARILLKIAAVLGREAELVFLREEACHLDKFINSMMWSEKDNFYYDLHADGVLSDTKTVGAYWGLISGAVPPEKLDAFISHLENEEEFKRPHRVTSLPANHPLYARDGGYWRGAIWPPTNYMILRGLTAAGRDDLAFDIAENHLENVWDVFSKYGTVYENYAPESAEPGQPAKDDFVGWGGLGPVAVLMEYYFGIRPNVPENSILWDIRLTDEHGVENYPFGKDGIISLHCENRRNPDEKPKVSISSNRNVKLILRWRSGAESIEVKA